MEFADLDRQGSSLSGLRRVPCELTLKDFESGPHRLRQALAAASGTLAGRMLSAATRKTEPEIGFGELGTKTATKPPPTIGVDAVTLRSPQARRRWWGADPLRCIV